jgi:hypothetical protein
LGRASIAASLMLLLVCAAPAGAAEDPGGDAATNLSVPVPGSYFGLADDAVGGPQGVTAQRFIDLAARAGANTIRTTLDWRIVEPTQRGWSAVTWARYDDFYARARAAGLTPLFTLAYAPWWARDVLGKLCILNANACLFPPRPQAYGDWARFAAEAARRYPDAMFEIWNEPNLRGYWQSGPDPTRYAQVQIAAYDAIKAVNPNAMVLSAGFANILQNALLNRIAMKEFLARAYAAGLKGHMDALAFHPYPGPVESSYSGPKPNLGPGSLYAKSFDDIRAVRDANGDQELPLFATEIGISTMHGVTRQEQADATRRIYNKTLSMDDVAGAVFHRIVEPTNYLVNATEIGYAWLRSGGTSPWPVYCTFVLAAGNSFSGC